MNLDKQSFQAAKQKFLTRFPGFTNFHENAAYADWERNYKLELLEYYQNTVAPLLDSFPAGKEAQAEVGGHRRFHTQRAAAWGPTPTRIPGKAIRTIPQN